MKYVKSFNKDELDALISIYNTLEDEDKKIILNDIIQKIATTIDRNKIYSKNGTARILEARKEDKLYARDKKTIQNHFNVLAKKIKTCIDVGKSKEARQLYTIMMSDAKLPRYEVQYLNAIKMYLSEEELEFLNGR